MKTTYKELKNERCPLTLEVKLFTSQVKGKHSADREFQRLAVRGKKLLTQIFFKSLEMETQKSYNLLE